MTMLDTNIIFIHAQDQYVDSLFVPSNNVVDESRNDAVI